MSKVMAIVAREMREAVPALIFFLVVFHMIAITKAVILDDYHISTTGSTIATVGALIVAKAILVVEKLPIARLFSGRTLYNILWKTLLFSAVSLLFRFVEELIPLIAKYNGLVTAAAHLLEEVSWPHFWVLQMWLYASLLLYCLTSELAHMIGAVKVKGCSWVRRLEHLERAIREVAYEQLFPESPPGYCATHSLAGAGETGRAVPGVGNRTVVQGP